LPQPRDIADDRFRRVRIEFVEQVETLFGGFGREQVQCFFDTGAEVQGTLFEFQFAGFDFGKVQNVIDDREQGFSAGADSLYEIALVMLKVRLQKQPGHGNHAVHGRADFMTHVREKISLGTRIVFRGRSSGFQLVIGAGQFIQQPLAVEGGADACSQFGRITGLDDMIPGPEIEAAQFQMQRGSGGEDNPWDIPKMLVERGKLISRMEGGQIVIENEQVKFAIRQ